MIRGSNLSEDIGVRLDESDLVFVEAALAAEFTRSVVVPGDLVFTSWGTIGQVGLIGAGNRFDRYLVSNKQMKMTPDPARASALFLYYYLSQPAIQNLIRGQAIGSSVPGFNLGQLKGLPITLPDLQSQTAIAEVLGALDDKIAANATLVTTADEVARLRFESLLVGAELRPMSSLARFVNGKAFTKEASGTGRVVVRIAELNSGLGGSTVYNDIDVADDHLARPGDLLFAWSGSLTVHRWFRPEGIVNQHIFKVIPSGYPMWVVKGALDRKLLEFKAIAADKATTMGHIQRRHLDEEVAVPTRDDIAASDAGMSALWDRALAAEQESLRLAALRDALLPQLISGRIGVRDAGRVLEGVV